MDRQEAVVHSDRVHATRAAVALGIGLFATSCAQSPAPPSTEPSIAVSGSVTDRIDRSTIDGVTITFWGPGSVSVTISCGRYPVEGLVPGIFRALIRGASIVDHVTENAALSAPEATLDSRKIVVSFADGATNTGGIACYTSNPYVGNCARVRLTRDGVLRPARGRDQRKYLILHEMMHAAGAFHATSTLVRDLLRLGRARQSRVRTRHRPVQHGMQRRCSRLLLDRNALPLLQVSRGRRGVRPAMARPATGRRPTVGAPRGVPRTTLGADADGPRLSPRERELVGPLTRHGESRNAAAETLGISVATLKTHVDRIYRKLGIHSRGELFAWAWQRQGRSERPEP